jgi:hypothetical protein
MSLGPEDVAAEVQALVDAVRNAAGRNGPYTLRIPAGLPPETINYIRTRFPEIEVVGPDDDVPPGFIHYGSQP